MSIVAGLVILKFISRQVLKSVPGDEKSGRWVTAGYDTTWINSWPSHREKKVGGRTQEIQRLIGGALFVVDLKSLISITLDCTYLLLMVERERLPFQGLCCAS